MSSPQRPVGDVLEELLDRYPNAPFLALGQTIWWDEPMKAVVPVLLAERGRQHAFIAGIHDTDYFAKAQIPSGSETRFALLPHNDGSTRGLWSAAGEISRLFGAECVPTRKDFTQHGVPLRTLLEARTDDRQAFLDRVTEAWGWRGLVYTGRHHPVVCELHLEQVVPGVRAMLEYGFEHTIAAIETPEVAESARAKADALIRACCNCCRAEPWATLTTLYKRLYPVVLQMLTGRDNLVTDVTSTSELLMFSPETCDLPRFRLVDTFLNPITRQLATAAYNAAVAGSEMYTLDRFGAGALPFDVVVPGLGRGTLRVTLRGVHVETREPVFIRTAEPVRDLRALAHVLKERFGEGVILVGKAVTLISMLATEFIFVFNELGSLYVHRTRALHDHLSAAGFPVQAYPILRLRYRTWDCARVVKTTVALPEPMRRPFGAQAIAMDSLAARWRQVVDEQHQLLNLLRRTRSPRDLLSHLQQLCPGKWKCSVRRYEDISNKLRSHAAALEALKAEARALYAERLRLRQALADAEHASSTHFRSVETWTEHELAHRERLVAHVRTLHAQLREVKQKLAANCAERVAVGRAPTIQDLRQERTKLVLAAEHARLELIREATLTSRNLEHTDCRPTAWWLPFVDPSGQWFQEVTRTATSYIQPLTAD